MGAVNHLDQLLELGAAAAVLVDADVKDEAAPAEQADALDEAVAQGGAGGLVLQQVPEPLDAGPGGGAGRLLGRGEVLGQAVGAEHDGGPGDDGEAEVGVVRGESPVGRAGLVGDDAAGEGELGEGVGPVLGGGVALAGGLDEDEAGQVGRGTGGGAELGDRVLACYGAVGGPPGQGLGLGGRVEVDVGVDDGEGGHPVCQSGLMLLV